MPRKPGLDGLRALAVIAVIVYHFNPAWLPGGFFGVDVFFVVSGYLITSLLVSEFRRFGDIDLKRFWLARARRLLPSVVVLLGAVILLSCLVARDALPSLRTDVLFSLLYVVNWWMIFHKVSYFASMGRPPLLLHLWSLAVEEQFYLLWPPFLLFLLRRVNLRIVLGVALAGAAASSWWMGALYHPDLDPSRAYFGTDSHAQGLLIGCALSMLVPPWAPRAEVTRTARRLLGVVGVAALAGLGYLLVTVGQYSPFAYPRGFILVDVCAAVLIVMVVHPATWLAPVAAFQPLRWVGTRSYALYLWHWPIIQLTRPDQDIQLAGWRLLILRLLLMAVAAELSHRLVEIPLKRPEVWVGWRQWVRTGPAGQIWAGLSSAVVAGVGALLLVVPGSISPIASIAMGSTAAARSTLPTRANQASATSPAPVSTSTPTAPPPGHTTSATVFPLVTPMGSSSPTVATTSTTAAPPTTRPAPSTTRPAPSTTRPAPSTTRPTPSTTHPKATTAAPTTSPPTTAPGAATTTPPTTLPASAAALAAKEPILAIGDSVMLAANPALTATFGSNIRVDASIGRQVDQGVARLQQYRTSGELAHFKTVVIDLGTNGPLTPTLFNDLVTVLQGVPNVVFYNTYDPRPWEATTNATLAAGIPAHPGMIQINWAAVAPGSGIIYPDGTHPTPAGATAYASLLNSALS